MNRWLDTPIEDVDFSVRTFNCLKKEAINTLGEMIRHNEAELLAIRNFGKRSLDEVIEKGVAAMNTCLLYTSPSPRDRTRSRMPSSA